MRGRERIEKREGGGREGKRKRVRNGHRMGEDGNKMWGSPKRKRREG